ncbi:MAG: OmpH family outer membrane protein, partial [Sphingomonas sp.]
VVARQQQLQTQLTAMLKPIDTNNDGQISDAELAVAQNAKNPVLQQYATARQTGEQDIGRISTPITRARLYVIEQIAQKYSAAANSVVANKKIGLLLSAGGVQYAQPSADVTGDIKAELDRTVPSVSIAAPANWQPSQQAVQLLQQYEQAVAAQAAQRGNAPAPAAGAKVPAPTGKKPTGR